MDSKLYPVYIPPNHYRLSSHSYGGHSESVGSATRHGVPTLDPAQTAPLNQPPSAVYLPVGAGKTRGTNGCTIPMEGQFAFGQTRTAGQSIRWTPTLGAVPMK